MQRREKVGEVRPHRKNRNGDGNNVVEQKGPAGDEGDQIVERVPREAGRPSGFGEGRRHLRIGEGRAEESDAGQPQRQRRGTQRVQRRDAQRVVDGRADIAVAQREQVPDPQDPQQSLFVGLDDPVRRLRFVRKVEFPFVVHRSPVSERPSGIFPEGQRLL